MLVGNIKENPFHKLFIQLTLLKTVLITPTVMVFTVQHPLHKITMFTCLSKLSTKEYEIKRKMTLNYFLQTR